MHLTESGLVQGRWTYNRPLSINLWPPLRPPAWGASALVLMTSCFCTVLCMTGAAALRTHWLRKANRYLMTMMMVRGRVTTICWMWCARSAPDSSSETQRTEVSCLYVDTEAKNNKSPLKSENESHSSSDDWSNWSYGAEAKLCRDPENCHLTL